MPSPWQQLLAGFQRMGIAAREAGLALEQLGQMVPKQLPGVTPATAAPNHGALLSVAPAEEWAEPYVMYTSAAPQSYGQPTMFTCSTSGDGPLPSGPTLEAEHDLIDVTTFGDAQSVYVPESRRTRVRSQPHADIPEPATTEGPRRAMDLK